MKQDISAWHLARALKRLGFHRLGVGWALGCGKGICFKGSNRHKLAMYYQLTRQGS